MTGKTELDAIIRDLIAKNGPLSVADYMQLALQHPAHGYYMKGDPLGVAGDFTTAPEISQIFGELLGAWCADMWRRLGKPDPFVLLEMGPGRGTLMQDALRATQKVDGFQKAMRLALLETNATLKEAQEARIGQFHPGYLTDMAALPDMPVIAMANEFFDALPIRQYVRTNGAWHERMIACEGDALTFVLDKTPSPLPLPEDKDFFEVAPLGLTLMQTLASHIATHRGAALVVDYGYVNAGGTNTLQAVSGHAPAPVLERAGAVDLTAHVDFTALKLAAEKGGSHVPEIVTQGSFLQALGIDLRAWQLKMHASGEQALAIDAAVSRLTGSSTPEQMGTLFKVMAVVSKEQRDVPGFP